MKKKKKMKWNENLRYLLFFWFSGKFLLESEDSSRHHSRNSSTGSNIPTSTIVVETYVEPEQQAVNGGVASTGSYHALQNHENHGNHGNHENHGVASNLAEEAERLLQQSDQRSSEWFI